MLSMDSIGSPADGPRTQAEDETGEKCAAQPEEDDAPCGFLGCYPPCLQASRTPRSYLFWLCWAGFIQSLMISGFSNVFVSTIERRFGISSTDAGWIIGGYDIASFVFILPVSYLGGRKGVCKPRWVAYGVILLALGAFVYSVPHFASGRYQPSTERTATAYCSAHSSAFNETCNRRPSQYDANLQNWKYVFILGQVIMGLGSCPLFTLGVTFIDDIVDNQMQPFYTGIFYAFGGLGSALGFIVGGQLLRIYVDFAVQAPTEGLVPGSSSWVGAWWLGFVVAGILLLAVAPPLMAFPARLPGIKVSGESGDSGSEKVPTFRQLVLAVKELATNVTFVFLSLEAAFGTVVLSGLGAFLTKIVESQFSLTSATSAAILGSLIFPCGCGGTFLAGYLIKRFQWRCESILKFSMVIMAVALVTSLLFLIRCSNLPFAGVNGPYQSVNSSAQGVWSLTADCNSHCRCSPEAFSPVCGVDNVLYYSPCHAGCTTAHGSGASEVYSECSCVSGSASSLVIDNRPVQVMATRQKCTSSCSGIYAFTALLFIFLLCTMMNTVPVLSATLRCVSSAQRTFALGAQTLVWRLLGTIPGPVIFGAFIDRSCALWQTNCGQVGNCLVYDNASFSKAMVGLCFTNIGLTLCSATSAWWSFRKSNKIPPPETKAAYDNPCIDPS